MFAISLLLLLAHTSLSEVYDLTADDLFESILGDVHEYQKKIDPPKSFSEVKSSLDDAHARSEAVANKIKIINETHVKMRVYNVKRTSTERQTIKSTQTDKPPNVTIDDLKQRMRKIQLNQMLETHTSPIPDFSNDGDNPIHITRRFQAIVKDVRSIKPGLRQVYFSVENQTRLRREKFQTIALMEQFIYAARYKMPYLQLLRKKYSYHLKYKIGYCFALLRHLKQQQKLIYSSLNLYYKDYTNLMIHMKLYEKVVRLDVDIRDVCFLIRRMNYEMKIEEKPDYYDESVTKKRFLRTDPTYLNAADSPKPDIIDITTVPTP